MGSIRSRYSSDTLMVGWFSFVFKILQNNTKEFPGFQSHINLIASCINKPAFRFMRPGCYVLFSNIFALKKKEKRDSKYCNNSRFLGIYIYIYNLRLGTRSHLHREGISHREKNEGTNPKVEKVCLPPYKRTSQSELTIFILIVQGYPSRGNIW